MRMASGDADALRLLFVEYSGRIQSILRRTLNDPEEVREAVQDTFLKAWRQASAYRAGRGTVFTWLIFIARNAAIDRLRRNARRASVLAAYGAEESATAAPTFAPADHDRRETIDRYLAKLAPSQRQALELAFFSGYTQAEIAVAMRAPVGNVKNYLRRGLHQLRQLFPPHE